jgi:hypothetical protein
MFTLSWMMVGAVAVEVGACTSGSSSSIMSRVFLSYQHKLMHDYDELSWVNPS